MERLKSFRRSVRRAATFGRRSRDYRDERTNSQLRTLELSDKAPELPSLPPATSKKQPKSEEVCSSISYPSTDGLKSPKAEQPTSKVVTAQPVASPDNSNGAKSSSDPSTAAGSPEKSTNAAQSLIRFQDDLQPIDTDKSLVHQTDEKMVRQGMANFKVKFIGFIEVKEPRGMPTCEAAVKQLRDLKKNKGKEKIRPDNGTISTKDRSNSKKKDDSRSSSRKNTRADSSNSTTNNNPTKSTSADADAVEPSAISREIEKVQSQLQDVTKLAENQLRDDQEIPVKRTLWQRMSTRKKRPKAKDRSDTLEEGGEAAAWKISLDSDMSTNCEGRKYKIVEQKAVLWISPDSLRLIDKQKNLILDQTIEKVSFCAPDSNFSKSFSYICRDGTSRKWWCYSFSTRKGVKGDRLSHAVGCAFNACLTRKLKLEEIAKQEAERVKEDAVSKSNDTLNCDQEVEGFSRSQPKSRASEGQLATGQTKVAGVSGSRSLGVVVSDSVQSQLTRQSIEQKHPELRQSMRKRPKPSRNASNLADISSLTKTLQESSQVQPATTAIVTVVPDSRIAVPASKPEPTAVPSAFEDVGKSSVSDHERSASITDSVLQPLTSIESILNGDLHREHKDSLEGILRPEPKKAGGGSWNPWEEPGGQSQFVPAAVESVPKKNAKDEDPYRKPPGTSRFDPTNPFYDHSRHVRPSLNELAQRQIQESITGDAWLDEVGNQGQKQNQPRDQSKFNG